MPGGLGQGTKNLTGVLEATVRDPCLLLVQGGFARRRYIDFLDYAVECLFLRRIGGDYIFVHRLLLDYFAAVELDLVDARPAATV